MRRAYYLTALAALIAQPISAQQAPYQVEARAMLGELVAFRSAQGQGQLHATADYIVNHARAAGLAADDIARVPAGESEGVILRLAGRNSALPPIIFLAHYDVVDARPEDWDHDPFQVREEGGFLIGRGVSDNKTGVTALLSALVRLQREGFRPERTILFTFVGDEETAQATTDALVTHPWLRGAAFAINSDAGGGLMDAAGTPRLYFIQTAEKTYASYRLTVRNRGGHSSAPRADNAIYDLARGLLAIEQYDFPVMANALTREYLGAAGRIEPGAVGVALRRFAENPDDADALAVLRADPEWGNKIATTCVATMLDAGHAENALPQRASATINCRIFPGASVADIQAQLRQIVGNPDIAVDIIDHPRATPASELTAEVRDAITRAVAARYPGVTVAPSLIAGATDGYILRGAGIPTFGSAGFFEQPGEGNEHGLNERIRVSSFYAAIDHYYALAHILGQ
ncbi:MAG: M20/M25/M40 family metallo-hydrolase [Sphingomonadaceae bacterium]|nr:M20/M25/M40 family metallo-hydrolase [Sphingomonadaceae bacterium]